MQCERGMRVTMWEELSSKLFNSEQKSNCPETIQNNVVFSFHAKRWDEGKINWRINTPWALTVLINEVISNLQISLEKDSILNSFLLMIDRYFFKLTKDTRCTWKISDDMRLWILVRVYSCCFHLADCAQKNMNYSHSLQHIIYLFP